MLNNYVVAVCGCHKSNRLCFYCARARERARVSTRAWARATLLQMGTVRAIEQQLAALVAEPIEAQIEILQRRVELESAPKVLAAVGVHVIVAQVERDHHSTLIEQLGQGLP